MDEKNIKRLFEKEKAEKLLEDIRKGTDELVKMAKSTKEKFDNADEKTKNQIIAGAVGAVALIAGIIGIKKFLNKREK